MLQTDLQKLCEQGQLELMETRYLDAAVTFEMAEHHAWESRDFDTLSRLYLPLQETRRQIRQRCGEGAVQMHLLQMSADQPIDAAEVMHQYPTGQLLVGGWGTTRPAEQIRQKAREQKLYLESFLAAVYPVNDVLKPVVAISPAAASLPPVAGRSLDQLKSLLPQNSLLVHVEELPADAIVGKR